MAGTGIPQPFTIAIPDAALDDLRHRLRTTRRPDDFDNADWSFGIERGWPEQMAGYWADAYDWRAQEAAMSAGRHLTIRRSALPRGFGSATATGAIVTAISKPTWGAISSELRGRFRAL